MLNSSQDTTADLGKASYHHGNLRSHLIATVRQLVEEKGADNFSISEAARRAGVSSAAPYKHFVDKTEIINEVSREGMRRLGEAMEQAVAHASAGHFAKINALGQTYVDFARAEPGVFRLMFGLTDAHENDEQLHQDGHNTYQILVREVANALPSGINEEEVLRRSYMLWVFVHGHAFLQIDGKVKKAKVEIDEGALLADISMRVLNA